jgi:DNA-binding NtrC family response regulator
MAARRKRNLLDFILSDSTSAICVLDADRRLRFFSQGMEAQTGWSADEVEGLMCDPSVRDLPTPIDLLTSTLAPTLTVLAGQLQSVQAVLPTSKSGLRHTRLTFIPVLDADKAVTRILIVSTEDKRATFPQASLSQKLHAEITSLRLEFRRRFSGESYIGNSTAIRKALDQAQLLQDSKLGYCIVGPSGTGRRHLAKLIHVGGRLHESSVVALDCRLLAADQLLTTLGQLHQLGRDQSLPSHQHAGTLVLVDVDRCPGEVQQWVLESRDEFSKVRLVGISEQPLQDVQTAGWLTPAFADLFSALQLVLPPLHERGDDVNLLAQHFVGHCRRTLETSAEALSAEVLAELQFYRWPGNIRELRQVIVDACQNSFNAELTIDDLPFSFRAGVDAQQLPSLPAETELSLDQILQKFETDVLLKTLAACRGNKADVARRLGMTRPKLYRRLKTLGIDTEE